MELTIFDINIQFDQLERWRLNDMHRASGGLPIDQPARWASTKKAQKQILFLQNESLAIKGVEFSVDDLIQPLIVKAGPLENGGGTYACKDLALTYAMWISEKFHFQVVRTFDRVQMEERARLQNTAAAYAAITTSNKDLLISDAALVLEIPKNSFFRLLADRFDWIYRRPGQKWLPKQKAVEQGFVARRRHEFSDAEGRRSSYQTVLTERGLTTVQQSLLPA